MHTELIHLVDLPLALQESVMTEFKPYSVSLSRVRNNDASTFRPLGSGVFVIRGGRFGILTAHHCLHACSPEVSIGHGGLDTLILIIHRNRSISLLPDEVHEHVLAEPSEDAYGPDLVFLEIAGEKRASILASASAWPLNQDPNSLKQKFGSPNTFIGMIGFPEAEADTAIIENSVHRNVMHRIFMNSIGTDAISARGDWDYIDSVCNYEGTPELPKSFGGVSGGPIWSMRIKKDKPNGDLRIESSALIGIVFYEGPIIGKERKIRGHYIDSIYKRAWSCFK